MREPFLVSIIIPVWRDEDALARTLERLHGTAAVEIIVCCALEEESRFGAARGNPPAVQWTAAPRGRASQMNAGAALARGRWLLFLHADTELPVDWLDVIRRADGSPAVVGGAFRLALDSRDWRARIIEAGVRLRIALFGLPYGDQAIFVRRQTFAVIGGYRDLPLMEDIDFVRRLKKVGRLLSSKGAVRTSARRWERDGWFRRSFQNASLAARYFFGTSPARLAQRYFRRRPVTVVMMARAPWIGGKTRLATHVGEAAHAELRQALFLDTLDVVSSVPEVDRIIACEPADACERLRHFVGPTIDVIAQRGDDLGQRLAHVFEDVFRLGAEAVVVIGSDLADLPVSFIRDAITALHASDEQIVVGPAGDGGYYLIGMTKAHPAIFKGIEWGTDRVFRQTIDAAKAQRLNAVLGDAWRDIDNLGDLQSLIQRSNHFGGARTRAWALEHLDRG